MTLNAVIRCNTCGKVSKKRGSQDGKCGMCIEIEQLRDSVLHLTHKNKTLRKSNTGLKAIVKRLKPYEPKQTFYDDGSNYLEELI